MKKIIFTIVGSMLISLCAVQAQQTDTAGTASKSKSKQHKYRTEQSSKDRDKGNRDQAWQQRSDRMRGDQAVVVIDVQEVPSNIRQKLDADEKYSGWEKATVYHNTRTGDYVFIPQPFRLDKEGNEQEMKGDQAWGYQNRYGQQDEDMSRQHREMSRRHREMSRQDQDTAQDMSPQDQARNEMGEIPTSASEDQSDGQPSSAYRTDEDQQGEQQQQQNSQSYRPGDQYSTANMVEVQENQIPEPLRTTLKESEYEGWKDNGKLYRNPSTSEYVLIIDSDASQERRFRFDANGERVDE